MADGPFGRRMTATRGAGASYPNLLVVGAMKCGTSALHRLLDRHPQVAMAPGKELNFFFGPSTPPDDDATQWWREGQWHRGREWYAAQFDPGAPVRGESSPGYTDPSHPEVAERVRALLPEVRLVYLVRDPFERAISQWRHHVRDGTERRPAQRALLDPDSQYLARSRYLERITPFLEHFNREQLLVVVQERLRRHTDREVQRVLVHAGADPTLWSSVASVPDAPTTSAGETAGLAEQFTELVADDLAAFGDLIDDPLAEWRTPPAARDATG